ncbi:unnamed protein product, partial [Prorocentrum cordatum]
MPQRDKWKDTGSGGGFAGPTLVADIAGRGIHMAARTCGDGACALHSAWGVVTEEVGQSGTWYYCENARDRVLMNVPVSYEAGQVDGDAATALKIWLDFVWADQVMFAMARARGEPVTPAESRGAGVIWEALSAERRECLEDFAELKLVETNVIEVLSEDLVHRSVAMFEMENRPYLKHLVVALGYVSEQDSKKLGFILDGVVSDPLELFRPSRTYHSRSRFDVMCEGHVDESRSLRRLLFLNNVHGSSEEGVKSIMSTLHRFQAEMAQAGRSELAHALVGVAATLKTRWEAQRLPDIPSECTPTEAWAACRRAWADGRYWFSVGELYMFAYFADANVEVFVLEVDGEEGVAFVEMPSSFGRYVGEQRPVAVVLTTDVDMGLGHFSRLLSSAEWESAEGVGAAPPAEMSDVGGGSADPGLAADCESLSDASDGLDVSDVQVDATKSFTTREDRAVHRIERVAGMLRESPLLPCDPMDPMKPFQQVHTGMRFPLVQCAFQGCTWSKDMDAEGLRQWSMEWALYCHIKKDHRAAFEEEFAEWDRQSPPERASQAGRQEGGVFRRVISDYIAALRVRESTDFMKMVMVDVGTAHSFHLPWEEIVHELTKHCGSESSVEDLPRKPAHLRYLLRVQMKVHGKLLERVLRQLTVRPYVLYKLLEYLIDHNHEAFRGKGPPGTLKEKMASEIRRWYPEDAGQDHVTLDERVCNVAEHVAQELRGEEAAPPAKRKRAVLVKEKSSIPAAADTRGDKVSEEKICASSMFSFVYVGPVPSRRKRSGDSRRDGKVQGRRNEAPAHTSPPGAHEARYDCQVLKALQAGWSEGKRRWCCEHEATGCEPQSVPGPATTENPSAKTFTTSQAEERKHSGARGNKTDKPSSTATSTTSQKEEQHRYNTTTDATKHATGKPSSTTAAHSQAEERKHSGARGNETDKPSSTATSTTSQKDEHHRPDTTSKATKHATGKPSSTAAAHSQAAVQPGVLTSGPAGSSTTEASQLPTTTDLHGWLSKFPTQAPPTTTRTTASSEPQTYDCEAGLAGWSHAWPEAKKAWCCQKADRGCPPPVSAVAPAGAGTFTTMRPRITSTKARGDAGCDAQCTHDGQTATCRAHIHLVAFQELLGTPDSCDAARNITIARCPACRGCSMESAGCDVLSAPAVPEADTPEEACAITCEVGDQVASCQDRIQWSSQNTFKAKPDACESSLELVLNQCPRCAGCTVQASGCQVDFMPAAAPPAAEAPPDCKAGVEVEWDATK